MIPVIQRISASGGELGKAPGDCVKCCVASILDLPYEAVPHFVAGEWLVAPRATNGMVAGAPERVDWFTALNDWLRETGWNLQAQRMTYWLPDPPHEYAAEVDLYRQLERPHHCHTRRGYWIASVISENYERSTHAVVMLDGAVAHDPSMLPRRTPYRFVGETYFVATNPALCRARAGA